MIRRELSVGGVTLVVGCVVGPVVVPLVVVMDVMPEAVVIVILLFVTCLGIAQADHHLIVAGCDTDKTCCQFADCSLTTSPTTPNLARHLARHVMIPLMLFQHGSLTIETRVGRAIGLSNS